MRASIADVRNKLSVGWLQDSGVIELTANNHVIGHIVPLGEPLPNTDPRVPPRTGVAAPTPMTVPKTTNSDPRVPHSTGTATQAEPRNWTADRQGIGLSKADQARGSRKPK
jgi:hypothetical protein